LAKVEWLIAYIEKTRRIIEKIVIKNNNAIIFINKKIIKTSRHLEKAIRTELLFKHV